MNTPYTAKKFEFGTLTGISQKQLDVHIKLYEGYVKFLNTLFEKQEGLKQDSALNAYALAEVTRRIGFEWNGMKMHEHYFDQWVGAPSALPESIAALVPELKAVAMMRGIGWAIISQDRDTKQFVTHWVSDHELGQLSNTNVILAIDMWEHAFMVDFVPAEKAAYVDAVLANVNGAVIASRITA